MYDDRQGAAPVEQRGGADGGWRVGSRMLDWESLSSKLNGWSIPQDTLLSIGVGLVVGLGIILVLARFPGEPFDYSLAADCAGSSADAANEGHSRPLADITGSSEHNGEVVMRGGDTGEDVAVRKSEETEGMDDVTAGVEAVLADEGRILSSRGIQRAKRIFGLTDDQVREAIQRSREEVRGGKPPTGAEAFIDHGHLSSRVDAIVYLIAFSALVYFLNRDYGGAATKFFRSFFPREAEVMFGPGFDEL